MRPLRWKAAFRTGVPRIDRRNKAFVDCLNALMKTAHEREHCDELESFVKRVQNSAEQLLEAGPSHENEIPALLKKQLIDAFPLQTHDTPSCRRCGLCDIGQEHLMQQLRESQACLAAAINLAP